MWINSDSAHPHLNELVKIWDICGALAVGALPHRVPPGVWKELRLECAL